MPNLNKVMLMGRLTRDPEVRFTPQGTPVTELGIAVNRVWFDQNRNKQEETTFVDVTAWDKQAQTIGKYLHKGSPIYVEGRLHLSTWETKEGEKRSKLRVRLENFQFLDSQSARGGFDEGGGGGAPRRQPAAAPQAQANEEWGSYSSGPSAPVHDDLGIGGEEPEVPF
jgi:single-strand DNA-binding protein